jgi:small-conductance mechanosensitive channel
VVSAILYLILAFIVASVVKNLTVKLLNKVKADKYTDKLGITDEKTGSSIEFFGKLVFFIVFVLFLPGVLDKLGLENVALPITSMVSQFLNFIPNIIAAVIILLVGIFVANIIRQLLTPVLRKLNIDRIQEKAGLKVGEGSTVSSMISYIVYILILIPVIIAALQVLNITAITQPAVAMLNKIVLFLPNIFVAIGIVAVGVFIANITGKLLTTVLSAVGADTFVKSLLPDDNTKLQKLSASKIIGETVRYIIVLLFLVEAFNVIQLDVLRVVGQAIIAYLPLAISAAIIVIIAFILSAWIEKLLLKNLPQAKILAKLVKYVIIVLGLFMTLNQLGIAVTIVNAAFYHYAGCPGRCLCNSFRRRRPSVCS